MLRSVAPNTANKSDYAPEAHGAQDVVRFRVRLLRSAATRSDSYIKALGTSDPNEAARTKKYAEAQLERIKRGRSPQASKLLAEGFSIVDVLFVSPEVAAQLYLKPEDSSRVLSCRRSVLSCKKKSRPV